ncbi:hypothetical protein Poly30_19560 [Planctomycetes bacterium Poly30]|uniref:Uncharacterized protein n=1 Tax=Saltatorellus ferox TaxID=2528018 RepID=A0A518EQT4_9BACT|nr:hypothetical protein Poly30_19560 [Planctomycetes bacterium Poly30]
MFVSSLLFAAQLAYIVPPEGAPMRHPSPVALPLVSTAFEDVRIAVALTGDRQRFARLRYGEPDSVRVTAVLDLHESGAAALYLDQNRDLVITNDELVPEVSEDARAWDVSLSAHVRNAEGETNPLPRRLCFELNESASILAASTLGWLEGEISIGEDATRVRRRDSNVNGFFGDHGDQLWIDRNGDGEWAAFGELYSSLPFLTLPEERGRVRYAVRSNREGDRLRLTEANEFGTIEIALHRAGAEIRDDVRSVEAILVGRDGTVVSVREHARATEVPTGDYRLSTLTLQLSPSEEDPEQPDWTFVFSEAFRPTEASWRRVAAGGALTLDPVREALSLELALPENAKTLTIADSVRAQPYLYLGADRLLIRNAYRGSRGWIGPSQLKGTVSLLGAGEDPLVTYTSQFL